MNEKKRYLIDFDILSAVEGETHIYATDLNNTILCMNVTARRFFKETLMNDQDPDGVTIRDFFPGNKDAADLIEIENKSVSDSEQAHLFYNRVHIDSYSLVDFITIKIPIYHIDNTLAGVLGISHYLEKRSADPAFEMGLTKREIECIYLLLDGSSYKDIAKEMKISSRTVESHLISVKNKLACESAADLWEKLNHAQLKTDIQERMNITCTNLSSNTIDSVIKKNKPKNKK